MTGVVYGMAMCSNSDGTDQLEVGWATNHDAIITATDVSTTGMKSVVYWRGISSNGWTTTREGDSCNRSLGHYFFPLPRAF